MQHYAALLTDSIIEWGELQSAMRSDAMRCDALPPINYSLCVETKTICALIAGWVSLAFPHLSAPPHLWPLTSLRRPGAPFPAPFQKRPWGERANHSKGIRPGLALISQPNGNYWEGAAKSWGWDWQAIERSPTALKKKGKLTLLSLSPSVSPEWPEENYF